MPPSPVNKHTLEPLSSSPQTQSVYSRYSTGLTTTNK